MLTKKRGPPVPPRPKPSSLIKRILPPDRLNVKNNSCASFEFNKNNYDNINITNMNENGSISNIHENSIHDANDQTLNVNSENNNHNQLIQMQMITVIDTNNKKSPKALPRHCASNKKSLQYNNIFNETNNSDDYSNISVESTITSTQSNNNNNTDYQNVTVVADHIKNNADIDDHSMTVDLIPKCYQTTKTIQLKQTMAPQTKNDIDHLNIKCKLEQLSVNYDNFDKISASNSSNSNILKNDEIFDKKVTFHEMLISELTSMRKIDLPKKRRKQSISFENLSNNSELMPNNCMDNVNNKNESICTSTSNLDDSGLEDEDRVEEILLIKQKQNARDKIKIIEKR